MTALEKFLEAFNQFSADWEKQSRIIVRGNEIVQIECEGFIFMGDEKEK